MEETITVAPTPIRTTEAPTETTIPTTEVIPTGLGVTDVPIIATPAKEALATTKITPIPRTNENYSFDGKRFYMILKVCYFDERGELSKKICHGDKDCEILGIYNSKTETIEFEGLFHPNSSVSPCRIEENMMMHVDFFFLLNRNPSTDTIYTIFKHLMKPVDFSNVSEIPQSTTSTEICCDGILAYGKNRNDNINIKYNIERMNKTEWVMESVKYSITKKLWNDLLTDAINMFTYMTDKDKAIFLV